MIEKDNILEQQAIDALEKNKRQQGHPTLFGHGVKINGKQVPHRANPKEKPPLTIAEYYGDGHKQYRRQYRSFGAKEQRQHIRGQRPFFALNHAYQLRKKWNVDHLIALVNLCGEDENLQLIEILQRPGILSEKDIKGRGNTITLTPGKADEYLRATPLHAIKLKKKINDDDPFKRIKLFLLDLQKTIIVQIDNNNIQTSNEIYWAVKNAIDRATIPDLAPITTHELVIDIDKMDGFTAGEQKAASGALALKIQNDIFARFGRPIQYIECSRNRKGTYLRFRIRRTMEPQPFNDMIGRLQKHLRDKYNYEGQAAKVDKIGGRLLYHFENLLFDEEAYFAKQKHGKMTNGAKYEWLKKHHGLKIEDDSTPPIWKYDEAMERLDYAGGDLITHPLHNLAADADGGVDRVNRYLAFQESDPITDTDLFAIIPSATATDTPTDDLDDAEEKVVHADPLHELNEQHCKRNKKQKNAKADKINKDDGVANENLDSQSRYLLAGMQALRECVTDITDPRQFDNAIERALELVEQEGGAASGPRHEGRIKRVEKVLSHAMKTFDPHKVGRGRKDSHGEKKKIWFDRPEDDPEDIRYMQQIVTSRISNKMLDEAKEHFRTDISYEHLGWMLAAFIKNIHTDNISEVSRKSVVNLLRSNGVEITNNEYSAGVWLLTHHRSRLLVKLAEAEHCYHQNIHRCSRYAIHIDCPLPNWLIAGTDKVLMASPDTGIITYAEPTDDGYPAGPSGSFSSFTIPHPNIGIGYTPSILLGHTLLKVAEDDGYWAGLMEMEDEHYKNEEMIQYQ